jgi:hypothetical protein
MNKDIHLAIHFVDKLDCIQKILKGCDRLIWLDYGVSVNQTTLDRLIHGESPVQVVPCVKDDVDWVQFRKKTLANTDEPAHQRALKFDIEATNKDEYISGNARVFSIDSKPVLKKLRGSQTNMTTDFATLTKLGVKISVLRSEPVICHYVYECIGNILESSGVQTTK